MQNKAQTADGFGRLYGKWKNRTLLFLFLMATVLALQPMTICSAKTYNGFEYEYISGSSEDANGKIKLISYSGTESVVFVPDQIDGTEVYWIDQQCFRGCSSIERIALPIRLGWISRNAIVNCPNLKKVMVGNDNTAGRISEAVLSCPSFEEIEIGNSVKSYKAIGGVLYSKDGSVLAACPQGLKTITIPNTVTEIGPYAFYHSGASVLTIPSGVAKIGKGAFDSAAGLVNAELKNVEIGESAFKGSGLESLKLKEGVTCGSGICSGCTKLLDLTIGKNVPIGENAFENCSTLKNVSLSAGVTLGSGAFSGCSALTEIELPEGMSALDGTGIFSGTAIQTLSIPSGMTTISSAAFEGLSKLSEIQVNTGNSAYQSINGILYTKDATVLCRYPVAKEGNSLTIPASVKTISAYALNGCDKIASLDLPVSLEEIGKYAFVNCTSLRNIDLPDTVQKIGEGAFARCGIEQVSLGSNIATLGMSAFSSCTSLKSVSVNVEQIPPSCFMYCDGLETVQFGPNVSSLGLQAFYGCTGLYEVDLPGNIQTIGNSCFQACSRLRYVTAAEGVKEIGQEAFGACDSLIYIELPKSISKLGKLSIPRRADLLMVAFRGTAAAVYPDLDKILYIEAEDWNGQPYSLRYCGNKKVEIIENKTETGKVEIPEKLLDFTVTAIGEGAFKDHKSVTGITIPDSVSSIGREAFMGCESLETIMLPEDLKKIGDGAFKYCSGLKEAVVPQSVQDLGKELFYGCSSLENAELPYRIQTIGDRMFYDCACLKEIQISGFVTAIGEEAFCGCRALKSVNVSNRVKTIGEHALGFYKYGGSFMKVDGFTILCVEGSVAYEYALTNGFTDPYVVDGFSFRELGDGSLELVQYGGKKSAITIPNERSGKTVTSVGEMAFLANENLVSVVIPQGVIRIGKDAFRGCPKIQSITIPNTVTGIGTGAFGDTDSLISLSVDASNTAYLCEGSVLYDKAKTQLIRFAPKQKTMDFVIPDSVRTISAGAFIGSNNLLGITIPEGVTTIEEEAFYACRNLKRVEIPSTVTSIGVRAFGYNEGEEGIEKITGFVIRAKKDSAAWKYATDNGFALEEITPENNTEDPGKKDEPSENQNKGDGSLLAFNFLPDAGQSGYTYKLIIVDMEDVSHTYVLEPTPVFMDGSSVYQAKVYLDFVPKSASCQWFEGSVQKGSVALTTAQLEAAKKGGVLTSDGSVYDGQPRKKSGAETKTKKENPVTVKAAKKTIRRAALSKKAQKVKPFTVKNAKGQVSYKLVKKGTNAKIYKKLKVDKKGAITVKKCRLKKGNYKIKVTITVSGDDTYEKKVIQKTVTIKVK